MGALCRDVLGLDATAAQTFGSLWGSLRGAGVELVLTSVRKPSMLRLLRAHGVALHAPSGKPSVTQGHAASGASTNQSCLLFADLDAGTRYCEERFLEVGGSACVCL